MTRLEEQFPSLVGRESIWYELRRKPASITKAKTLEFIECRRVETNPISQHEKMYREGTILKHCLDKQRVKEAIEKIFGEKKKLEECSKKIHIDASNWPRKEGCENWMKCDDSFYSYCGCGKKLYYIGLFEKELGL